MGFFKVFWESDIGRQYNASGDISNASYIADACWHIVYGLQEATIGAGEGVVQGVGNTGHIIAHPVATVQNIGCGFAWLINGVITNTTDACTLMFGDDAAANVAWDSLCDRVRHVKDVLEYLRDNASIRNVSSEATSFVVEGYLQHKMISTLAEFYNNADRYAANIAEHIPPYQEKTLLQTAEGLPVYIADEVAIETSTSKYMFFQEIEKSGTKNPYLGASQKRIHHPRKVIDHPVVNNIRTKSALKLDNYHAFNDIVDNYAQYAEKFIITGNDGIKRDLYQIGGTLNGVEGIFEWIVDPRENFGVTHRLFIKNGKITGIANVFK